MVSGTTPIPVTTSGTLRGATFANGYLWQVISETSALGKIIRIDTTTNTTLDTILAPGNNPRSITWLNNILYCNDTDSDKVFQYNITTKKWTGIFTTPYVTTVTSAGTSSKFATGFSNDGVDFWIANSSISDDRLFKVNTSGQVLYVMNLLPLVINTLSATTTDMGGITGIAFVTK
jgi:hypothetical protein